MKKILLFSLIFTLPINVLGLLWVYNTKQTYTSLEKYKFTLEKGNKLKKVGIIEFDNLMYHIYTLIGISHKTDVSLYIKENKLRKLQSNLPKSSEDYKKNVFLIVGDAILKGKAKFRGDHFYHWMYPNKSWRFKMKKNKIYKGLNKINFIYTKSPNFLGNHLSYKLAKRLNLLAPDSDIVDFSLNGHYNNTRLMVGQIDEGFLRNNRRMPNDIYKGDNIGQNTYVGVDVLLFENPSIWNKASYNNHYVKEYREPLKRMIENIQNAKYDMYDLKSFAAMTAYIDIAGTYHHDRTHNWILYYDNYLEKMFPIIWDSLGFVFYSINLENYNIVTSELLVSLYENYDFIREKNHIIKDFFNNKEKLFLQDVENSAQVSRQKLKNIPYSFAKGKDKLKLKDPMKDVDLLVNNIKKRLKRVKKYFIGSSKVDNFSYALIDEGIRLKVSGNKLIKGIKIHGVGLSEIKDVAISYKQNGKKQTKAINSQVEKYDNTLILSLELFANLKQADSYKHTVKYKFAPVTYDIHLKGINSTNIKAVDLAIDNTQSQIVPVRKIAKLQNIEFNPKLKNIIKNYETKETEIWQGEKTFTGFNIIENDIIIKPGTSIKLAENATIKVLGKVTAIATKDKPIVFAALDNTKPWGAFALKDEAANGSVFKHVIFKGGSGNKGDLHEYTAMLSIHHVKNVLIENSEFYDSKITDDSVHIIYSDVIFRNSKFVRSLSDALDSDISTLVVDNCEFIDSGNDSIDLMTSNALVINTKFTRSADKGISIGEGSNLLAINNLIVGSEIGMQSKDTSLAHIYNTSFINNKKAIDAYHKNLRYAQGGTILIDKSIFKGNQSNATVGKKSKVVINDSQIDTADNFDKKNIRKKKIIISQDAYIPYDFNTPFFQNKESLIKSLINKKQHGYHE